MVPRTGYRHTLVYIWIHLELWTQPEKDSRYILIHLDTSRYIRTPPPIRLSESKPSGIRPLVKLPAKLYLHILIPSDIHTCRSEYQQNRIRAKRNAFLPDSLQTRIPAELNTCRIEYLLTWISADANTCRKWIPAELNTCRIEYLQNRIPAESNTCRDE